MKIVEHTTFRSSGTLVNQTDDMVRVVVDMSKREFWEFRAKLSHNSGGTPCSMYPCSGILSDGCFDVKRRPCFQSK